MALRSGSPLQRVTVVTGAASGIGLASASLLAERGDVVALIDLDEAAIARAADRIRDAGGTVRTLVADVLDLEALVLFTGSVVEEFGGLAYAFSNAGIDRRRPAAEMTLAEWDAVLQTHVTGAFNVCKAVLPHMAAGGSGSLVLMASDFAIVGLRGQANYTAAKTALYSLAKSLAVEFAGSGIRVNAVGPGPIDTPLLRAERSGETWAAAQSLIEARVPMARLGRPAEVAATVAFLLSDRSAYVTGQLLQPNGGQVMW